jgi:hypothetical protein
MDITKCHIIHQPISDNRVFDPLYWVKKKGREKKEKKKGGD